MFRYPEAEIRALDNISLSIQSGEFVIICGESGCGKSTLLRLLKRELAPYGEKSGDILYHNTPLTELDERTSASDIGFVLQNPESQIVTDKVWHELAFGLESLGYEAQVIRRRVSEMASYFGIEEWFHKKTTELSGGQKQVLNLASVMAMQPKVLLLDEPTAQLDPIAAGNFISTLQKLNRELGLTILLVEHRLEDVFPVADRVLMMEQGKVVFDGCPKDISNYFEKHPSHPMTVGLPAAMRIYHMLKGEGECPIIVREGREYIRKHYKNEIDTIESSTYVHDDETIVELNDVWFRYERALPDVMRGVSLQVFKGEHFCILGGNGVGKTTTLEVFTGILKPYRGKVKVKGKVVLLPQNPQTLFLEKTVKEDLLEAGKIMQYETKDSKNAVKSISDKLNITHLLQMHPYDLSGGEQQKAALAKILLLQPQILLLDEPTKGIDACAKRIFANIIRDLKKEGITVVTVTHDVEFAATEADRCGMFFDGKLVSVDTPTNFFSENSFYTTAANRISRGYFQNAICCEEVAELCMKNGRKAVGMCE